MKYSSFLLSCLVQQSAVRAVETLERAKKHCEDWFVYQGEQLENILVVSLTLTNAKVKGFVCQSFTG